MHLAFAVLPQSVTLHLAPAPHLLHTFAQLRTWAHSPGAATAAAAAATAAMIATAAAGMCVAATAAMALWFCCSRRPNL